LSVTQYVSQTMSRLLPYFREKNMDYLGKIQRKYTSGYNFRKYDLWGKAKREVKSYCWKTRRLEI